MSMMDPMPEMCTRECCARPCAKNPRTGEYHKFCSLRCSRMHKQRLDDEPLPSKEHSFAFFIVLYAKLSKSGTRKERDN
ncbi:hypothetical protein DPMN_188748 [Dreissena polymorpha]|uniref:Uncharacterized protein n=1 Tax=Dreissena polymorpha TaxID=45954 RepID=A0A9D4IBM3_DREPO|nr:hypothetical protein DPMN_188748 [Dreissena polymorpha]